MSAFSAPIRVSLGFTAAITSVLMADVPALTGTNAPVDPAITQSESRSRSSSSDEAVGIIAFHNLTRASRAEANASTALHASVESDELSAITVAPGAIVDYQVVGLLSDDANEGLALVGFNLDFDGGALAQADSPTGVPAEGCDDPANYPFPCCENPMINFTQPWGVTNPAGYGGTIIGGDLIQIGGGQNTIKNTPDTAPFPIGPVLTGVAQPSVCGPAVLVTGSLVAPLVDGEYTLALEDLFANVIREGEDGSGLFWATEAAMVGTISNLTVTVTHIGACCGSGGSCIESDETACINSGGTFRGAATPCGADGDGDNVADACDLCSSTPSGRQVNGQGCEKPKAGRRMPGSE